jgi:hypothetical protein
VNGS